MKKIKIISFVLAMLFLFYAIPMNIYAEFEGNSEQATEMDEPIPSGVGLNAEGKEVFWVEDIYQRTESTKTFHLSDGTSIVCDYGTVVHHKLENDTFWRVFQNEFKEYESDYTSRDLRVKYQKKITGNENIYTIHSQAGKITLGLSGAKKKTAGVVLPGVQKESNAGEMTPNAFLELSQTEGTIVYSDILDYVDIEYILSNADIKENIYLKQKEAQNSFSFELKLNGMCALLDEEGNVCIYTVIETIIEEEAEIESETEVIDKGEESLLTENETENDIETTETKADSLLSEEENNENNEENPFEEKVAEEVTSENIALEEDISQEEEKSIEEDTQKVVKTIGSLVYVIPAPIVYDAGGKVADSTSSWYTLEGGENGKYTLTVTVDRVFLDANDTQYPVVIDPTLSPVISQTVEKVKNEGITFAVTGESTAVNSNSVYYWQSPTLPNVPSPENIISATLSYKYKNADFYTVGVSPVNDVNGNYEQVFVDFVQDTQHKCPTGIDCIYEHELSFNLTDVVKDWYLGNRINYGVAIYNIDDSTSDGAHLFDMYSANADDKDKQPTLTILYRNPMGIEPYYSYFTQSVVSGTTGYVNYANGALTHSQTLFQISTPFASCPLSLMYDSNLAGKSVNAPNIQSPEFGYTLPDGFFLSIGETILKSAYMQADGTLAFYYIYRDADGTEHSFYDFDGNHQYEDENGLGFTLYFANNIACIEAKDKSTRVFALRRNGGSGAYGEAYHLTWVLDEKNNGIYIELDSNDLGRPLAIYSVIGANATRELDSDKITSVSKCGAKKMQEHLRLYYTGADLFLQSVVSPLENCAYLFEYDQQGKFASITRYYSVDYKRADVWDAYFNYDPIISNPCVPESEQVSPPPMEAYRSQQYIYTMNSEGYLTQVKEQTISMDTPFTVRSVRYGWFDNQVWSIDEYDKDSHRGDTVNFHYYNGKTSIDRHNVNVTYVFDNSGRVILTYTTDTENHILGATAGAYSVEEGAENKLASSFQQDNLSLSYLENGKFNYGLSQWNASGNIFLDNVQPDTEFDGYYAYIGNGSLSQTVTLPAGEHVLAFYVKSKGAEGQHGYVKILSGFGNENSPIVAQKEIPLNSSSEDVEPYFVYVPFNVPFGGDVTVQITYDGISTPASNSYFAMTNLALGYGMYSSYDNLIEFSTFEQRQVSADTIRYYTSHWRDMENDSNSSLYEEDSLFGNSLKLMGAFGMENTVTQTVYTAPQALLLKYGTENEITNSDKEFVLHAFGKSSGAFNNTAAFFGLQVNVYYYQGADSEDARYTFNIPFTAQTDEWQFVLEKINVPTKKDSNDSTDYSLISKIEVSAVYSNQPDRTDDSADNYALFDNIYFGAGGDAVRYEYKDGLVAYTESGDSSIGYIYGRYDRLHANWTSTGDMMFSFYEGNSTLVNAELSCRFTTEKDEGEQRYTKFNENTEDLNLFVRPIALSLYTYNEQGQLLTTTTYSIDEQQTQTIPSEVLSIFGLEMLSDLLGCENAAEQKGVTSSVEYYDITSNLYGLKKRESDTLGNSCLYLYDTLTLRPLAIVNEADGTAEVYDYNTEGLLVKVKGAVYTESNILTPLYSERVEYEYNSYKELKSITTGSTEYKFTYNSFGDASKITAGDRTLAQYTYDSETHLLHAMIYGNGTRVNYNYDDLDRLTEVWYTEGGNAASTLAYKYIYQANGALSSFEDYVSGEVHSYTYDATGRLTASVSEKVTRDTSGNITGSTATTSQSVTYDDYDRISQTKTHVFHSLANSSLERNYTYSAERNILESVQTTLGATTVNETYTIDNLGRLTTNTISLNGNLSFGYGYTYTETNTATSGQISTVTVQGTNQGNTLTDAVYTYTYDGNGNIIGINKTVTGAQSEEYHYYYDRQGQLTREENSALGRAYHYTYDDAGNILIKYEYAYATQSGIGQFLDVIYYTYEDNKNWGDLLTKYDGQTITYDTIGNPLSYYNGQRYTFTWTQGRRLSTATLNGVNMSFLYDDQGLRTQKVVGNTTITYTWSGTTLLSEATDTYILIYLYDESASPIGFQYKTATTTETYFYEKNIQGDIVAVYSESGVKLISYTYDAWGNANISFHNGGENTNATKNPFTYRGYYYDAETGFYYVSSRYYDPDIARWINADITDVLSLPYYHHGQYNLFSYCNNNPVNDRDDDGQLSWLAKIAIGVAAIAIGVGVTALTGGAALPALVAGVKAACVAGAISAGTSAATAAVRSAVSGDSFSTVVQKSAKAAAEGFADGFMAGGVAAGASQVVSGGFKIAAKIGAKTGKSGGIKIGNTKILSPDAAWHKNNGGTLLKVGKTFRIDVGSNTLLHMHLSNVSSHIQIGTIGAGIYGGLK